jgi:hypothetical protein
MKVPVLSKKLNAAKHKHPLITVVTALLGWGAIGKSRGKKSGKPDQAMQQALMTGGAFVVRFLLSHVMHKRKGSKVAKKAASMALAADSKASGRSGRGLGRRG